MVRHAAVAVSVQTIHGMHTVDGIYSVHTMTADVAQGVYAVDGTQTSNAVDAIDRTASVHNSHSIVQSVTNPIQSIDSIHLCNSIQPIHIHSS